jgi:hypothetical protein
MIFTTTFREPIPVGRYSSRNSEHVRRFTRLVKEDMPLRTGSLSKNDGMYADRDEQVAAMASEIESTAMERVDVIERLIDTRPFRLMGRTRRVDMEHEQTFQRLTGPPVCPFLLDRDRAVEVGLPTAGRLLDDRSRLTVDENRAYIVLVHELEPYILGAAVLRELGYDAYPAEAVTAKKIYPIIAILERGGDVATFDLLREHPPMQSLNILSDSAVLGAGYAIMAEIVGKRLATDMLMGSCRGTKLPPDEIEGQLKKIGELLFLANTKWRGCHYIREAMVHIHLDIFYAVNYVHDGAGATAVNHLTNLFIQIIADEMTRWEGMITNTGRT